VLEISRKASGAADPAIVRSTIHRFDTTWKGAAASSMRHKKHVAILKSSGAATSRLSRQVTDRSKEHREILHLERPCRDTASGRQQRKNG
jgi:hypothetical protein